MNLITFSQYLNDMTGYLNSIICAKTFQLLLEFMLMDLQTLFNTFLNPNSLDLSFKD